MQKRLPGRNPNSAVRIPMRQMIMLFAPATTQPCHNFFPTMTVERTDKTHDRKPSLSRYRLWNRVLAYSKSTYLQFRYPRDNAIVIGRTGATNLELSFAT